MGGGTALNPEIKKCPPTPHKKLWWFREAMD